MQRRPAVTLSALVCSLMLHLLAVAVIVWLGPASFGRTVSTAQASEPMTVVAVPPPEEPAFYGLNPIDTTLDALLTRQADESSTLSTKDFTFEFGKIANQAALLFPFLVPGLSLERFGFARRPGDGGGSGKLFTPLSVARPSAELPPLNLPNATLRSLIDKSWSRRDRWDPFQHLARLADSYSPDVGQLPVLFHAYLEENGLQPYVSGRIPDPRLWAMLGVAADHLQFVEFISRFASAHPSTKAATELLFLLDKLAQSSFDILATLLSTDPVTDLDWTRDANADAYDLIVKIRRFYDGHLERRGLTSRDALRAYYDDVRLAILSGILRTTPNGYRASDARFLIGDIYWRQGNASAALRSWRDLTIDPTDGYATASSGVLTAMNAHTGVSAAEINQILNAVHGRWLSFSFDRLRQFGYRFDTF